MTATSTIEFTDLSQQKRLTTELDEDLTVNHNVDQAIQFFLEQSGIPDNGLQWGAFSRGVRLGNGTALADLDELDRTWTVVPTVSAGAC